MKKIFLFWAIVSTQSLMAQNVGIGTTTPQTSLHILSATDEALRLDAPSPFLSLYSSGVYKGYFSKSPNYIELGSAAGSNLPITFAPNGVQRIYVGINGNLGIGNNYPLFPLSFSTALGDKISLLSNGGDSYGFGVQNSLLQIHTTFSVDDIAFGYGSSSFLTETMRIKGNGNVGIGTTIPGFPLNFANVTGDKISLYGNSGAHYGFGIQGYLMQVHSSDSLSDIAFGYGSSSSFTERMRIKGNGNVGIGTIQPGAQLHIASTNLLDSANGAMIMSRYWSNSSDARSSAIYHYYNSSTAKDQLVLGVSGDGGANTSPTLYNNAKMVIQANGNVGIGNNTPGFPLNFSQVAGDKISLFGNSGAHYGFGIQGYLMQIHSSEVSADIAFGYGSSSSFTETMRIKGNGKVGIGTTTPAASLEVNGYTKLGSDAPLIKVKKITGTTAASEGGLVDIAHGLTFSKILSVSVLVLANNFMFPANYTVSPGYHFEWLVSWNGAIAVKNIFGASANILSQPIKILITYEE